MDRRFEPPALLLILLLAGAARGEGVNDPLSGAKLSPDWVAEKSAESEGSIGVSPKGVTLNVEQRRYAILKRRNELPGSDAAPLRVSAYFHQEHESNPYPGLHLFWDRKNWISIIYTASARHLYVNWSTDGQSRSRGFWNVLPDPRRESGAYLRIDLTSNNAWALISRDGTNWNTLCDLRERPGRAGEAPGRIILGRGWNGEAHDANARLDLANDYYPDKNKRSVPTTIKDFVLAVGSEALPPELPEMAASATWDETLQSLEGQGVPRNWLLLGPRPDKNFQRFNAKTPMEPESTDDWKQVPKDENNQPFRSTSWSRPEDDTGPYVDMAEILDPDSMVLAFARAEVEWPVEGPALLWTDSDGLMRAFVNNESVFEKDKRDRYWQHRGALKDRFCVPVRMRQGANVIKVKSGQNSGAWGFHLRLERNDPGYRIRLLERMLQLFPAEQRTWRGAEALLEIARRYEQMFDYTAAQKAYDRALGAFETDDEYRVQALGGKLRLLESLRDWKRLQETAEAYLKRYAHGAGGDVALRALALAQAHTGAADAAAARMDEWLKGVGVDGRRVLEALRALAGAAEDAGLHDKRWAALERIAREPGVEAPERARAALESAFTRLHVEYEKAYNQKPLDPVNLKGVVEAAKAGIALLPSASNPQVQAFLKDADTDLKSGKHERAALGAWAAALMAWSASDPEVASYLALSKAYAPPSTAINPENQQPRNTPDAQKELEKVIGITMGGVKWLNEWHAVGPFDARSKDGENELLGPESSLDPAKPFKGKGGPKKWVAIDPAKHWTELGQDLKQILGDCNEGVAFVGREFECDRARTLKLWVSARAGWSVYLDGKLVAERPENWYRVEREPVEFPVEAGKHLYVLKLVNPPDNREFPFRTHLADEPPLACWVFTRAWLMRDIGSVRNMYDVWDGLWWIVRYSWGKAPPMVMYRLGEACAVVYPGHTGVRWDASYWTLDRLREATFSAEASQGLRSLLLRLETWGGYGEQEAQLWACAERLFGALMAEGETSAADEVLRDAVALYDPYGDGMANALIGRATLRQNFSLSRECAPYYLRALRDFPWNEQVNRFAAGGLVYSREHRPERLAFDTRHETQATIEATQRQMQAGGAEDVERAMRNLSDIIRVGGDALIRVVDSRFDPLYVGVREYIRALLSHLGDDTLAVYRKVVKRTAEQALDQAISDGDPVALESLAGAFYYTPAAAEALNRSGNLYLDRGAYPQAAAAFRILLKEYRNLPEVKASLVAAKAARALILEGNLAAAQKVVEQLETEFGAESFTVAGAQVTGAGFAKTLREQMARRAGAQDAFQVGSTSTLNAGLRRTGQPSNAPAPVPGTLAWARPLIPSESAEVAATRFYPDPFSHLVSHPVSAEGRLFVTTPESIQAFDLATGSTLWSEGWGSDGRLVQHLFSGFPISCPTVLNGKLYFRALKGRRSALYCCQAETGKLRWSTEAVPELNRVVWLSDPLVAYGQAIAVYVEPSDVNQHGVAALDAETGRFRWKRPLVTGSTGLHIGDEYFGSSMQLGPPAADAGVIYTPTGCNTVAAINAFTGELIWLSGYPRLEVRAMDYGIADYTRDMGRQYMKVMARGPVSPVVGEEVVVIAPKDAGGLLAFERRGGKIRWQRPLCNSRFLPGVCDGNLLVADNVVEALDLETGASRWSYALPGEQLYGRPGYAGGVLYLPTEECLRMLDARSGVPKGELAWDPRVGPLANLLIQPERIVGVGGTDVAAYGPQGTRRAELPLKEAEALAAEGKHEDAAAKFELALQRDKDLALPALSGRIQALQRLGRAEEALASLDRFLEGAAPVVQTPGGLWRVDKQVLAEAFRARLGQPAPPPPPPAAGQAGVMLYAWDLPGNDPEVYFPKDGPQDRFYALANNVLYMLRISARKEVLWQTYVGPDTGGISVGPDTLVVRAPRQLKILDRVTGEPRGTIYLPMDKKRKRGRADADRFGRVALNDKTLAVVVGTSIFAYDLRTLEEKWTFSQRNRQAIALSIIDNRLVSLFGWQNDDVTLQVHDVETGRRLSAGNIDKGAHYGIACISPDGKFAVYRHGYNRLIGVSLDQGKKAWSVQAPRLDDRGWAGLGLDFEDGKIVYYGHDRDNQNRGWRKLYLDTASGKVLRDLDGGTVRVDENSWLCLRDRSGRILSRSDEPEGGKAQEVWKNEFPEEEFYSQWCRGAFLQGGVLHVLHGRTGWGASDRYILRAFDWETGQLLDRQNLPVTPSKDSQNQGFAGVLEMHGPLLLIGGKEGLFAFTARSGSKEEIRAKLQAELSDPQGDAAVHRELRRAQAAFAPITLEAFLAPSGIKVDGDLSEWSGMEPLPLDDRAQFTPFAARMSWKDANDLSAKVWAGWNEEGIYLAVDVRDDRFVPPLPGADLGSGDSLRVALNGYSEPRYGIDRSEDLVCSLSLVDGRTVVDLDAPGYQDEKVTAIGRVNRAPDGLGLRYELLLPWPLIRRDARKRPGHEVELYFGLALFDDDGQGVEGAMEWGAGLTGSALTPVRLGRLSLLDISTEKIERFRKVIDKVPDAPESLHYLELILRSKRGLKAPAERKAELENFVKAHPGSVNVTRVLGHLIDLARKAQAADPYTAVAEFARAAKCPPDVVDAISGKVLRIWVMPDKQNPPR
ncbi:MAG: PQQ-binding-like beta-propeller repeat protein [Planctomycetota bacterium]|nr:PQQ-binding-like beta-propeller repeat protein [Planctomycetota bacterium]